MTTTSPDETFYDNIREERANLFSALAKAEQEIERLRKENEQLRDEWQRSLIDASILRDKLQETK